MMDKDTPEAPVKVSVFLDRETHREATIAALDSGVSLSRYISSLLRKHLDRQSKKAVKSA